jgi:hypothetical protein
VFQTGLLILIKTHRAEMLNLPGGIAAGEDETPKYAKVAHGHEHKVAQDSLEAYRPEKFSAHIIEGPKVVCSPVKLGLYDFQPFRRIFLIFLETVRNHLRPL